MKTIATWIFVVIWFINLVLGVGAGYAALRLWYSRHQPLLRELGLYINAFVIDVIASIVLLFVSKGVKLTWKFSAVLFISVFLGNILRAPLILLLIRGQKRKLIEAPEIQTSGELPPSIWHERFDRLETLIKRLFRDGNEQGKD